MILVAIGGNLLRRKGSSPIFQTDSKNLSKPWNPCSAAIKLMISKAKTEKTRSSMPLATYFVLAQAIIIIAAITRVKVVTLILGAQGIAFYGILANLVQIGTHISTFGMHSSGVRSVAKVRNDPAALEETIGLYFFGTTVFTIIATFFVPAFAWFSGILTGLGGAAHLVGPLIGLAIFLAAIATAQGTVFKGLGAARLVVLRNIVMPLAGLLSGIIALLATGLIGVTGFLIFEQLAGVILSAVLWHLIVKVRIRLPDRPNAATFNAVIKPMLFGGAIFLVSSLIVETTILFGRWSLQRLETVEQLAFLNASWVLVTMSYGFVQGIMSTWLYPLLAHAAHKHDPAMSRGVDAVVFLTSMIGSAFVMVVAPFTPLILRLIYNDEFTAATPDFNLALIGLMAQIVAAPLLYLLLARSQDRGYLIYHVFIGAIFAGGVAFSAADSARDVLIFYVTANWIGAGLLIVVLHFSGHFSLQPRTIIIGGAALTAAAAAAHYGQSSFVRSEAFLVIPIGLLVLALLTLRKARRSGTIQTRH